MRECAWLPMRRGFCSCLSAAFRGSEAGGAVTRVRDKKQVPFGKLRAGSPLAVAIAPDFGRNDRTIGGKNRRKVSAIVSFLGGCVHASDCAVRVDSDQQCA